MILRNQKRINENNIIENSIKKSNIIETIHKTTINIKKCNLKNNQPIKKYKYVLIRTEPIIKYYFLSQKEKNDKIKAFNIIITNFKNE